jgi:hypothetical protein
MRGIARILFGAGTRMPSSSQEINQSDPYFPAGNWYGNDTIWRTVDDLNRILFFYDTAACRLMGRRVRRYFAVVDGITSMEGNGPLRGTPRNSGVVLAGADPVVNDVVAATLMGFDWHSIPMLQQIACHPQTPSYSEFSGNPADIRIASNRGDWNSLEQLSNHAEHHAPPAGWRHHMEM